MEFERFSIRPESGQTMPEYAAVLTMITLAIVTAIAALSGSIIDVVTSVAGLF